MPQLMLLELITVMIFEKETIKQKIKERLLL